MAETTICNVCNEYEGSPQAVGMHKFHTHGIRSADRKRKAPKMADVKGEDVVLVVLAQLFPQGIPVPKLAAVLEWASQTEKFVASIRDD